MADNDKNITNKTDPVQDTRTPEQKAEDDRIAQLQKNQTDTEQKIQTLNSAGLQISSTIHGTPIPVDQSVINTWNQKRFMGNIELSTLSPFVIVFLVLSADKPSDGSESLIDLLQKKGMVEGIDWWRAEIEGYGKTKIVVPVGGSKSIYKTVNFAGGIGITNFEIGYQKMFMAKTGKITFEINSLDEFDTNFTAAALLSLFNIFYVIHGWMGPGIWINLPFDIPSTIQNNITTNDISGTPANTAISQTSQDNQSQSNPPIDNTNGVWKTKAESINPGWWSANTVYMYKRNFNPNAMGFTLDCEFSQIYPGHEMPKWNPKTSDNEDSDQKQDSQQRDRSRNYVRGNAFSIHGMTFDKAQLLSKLHYVGNNREYIENLINNTWYNNVSDFTNKYSIKRKNEQGKEENVYDTIFYPVGIVLESVLTSYHDNQISDSEPELARIHYSEIPNGVELPEFKFSIFDEVTNKASDFTIPIKTAFDIPVDKKAVDFILRKPYNRWKDTLRDIINIIPSNYRVTAIGGDKIKQTTEAAAGESPTSANTAPFTLSLDFTEQKWDSEFRKQQEAPDEFTELVFDYRVQNSLMGEVRYESSGLGLEQIQTPLILKTLFGKEQTLSVDKDSDGTTVTTESPKTLDDSPDKKQFTIEAKDISKDDATNTEFYKQLFGDRGYNRGLLIRGLSQVVSFDIHGLGGLLPFQECWVRGLTTGLNGKHCLLSINDVITPQSYSTSLRLANMVIEQIYDPVSKTLDVQTKQTGEQLKKATDKKNDEQAKLNLKNATKDSTKGSSTTKRFGSISL